jgi:hypothetical protein
MHQEQVGLYLWTGCITAVSVISVWDIIVVVVEFFAVKFFLPVHSSTFNSTKEGNKKKRENFLLFTCSHS